MKTIDRDDCYIAHNNEELLDALNKKETYIIITEDFKKTFLETSQEPFTANETMGVNLGSAGGASLFGELFYQIGKLFSNDPSEQKKIDSKLRSYTLKKTTNGELLLYLSQLDY